MPTACAEMPTLQSVIANMQSLQSWNNTPGTQHEGRAGVICQANAGAFNEEAVPAESLLKGLQGQEHTWSWMTTMNMGILDRC